MLLAVLAGGGLGVLAAASLREFPAASPNAATPLVDVELGVAILPNELVTMLYALFGLGINIFALSRAIVYALRLGGELTRDGFLPKRLQTFSTLRGTPVLPLALLALLSILLVFFFQLPFLAGLAALCVVGLALDGYVSFGFTELFVPGASSYRPAAVAVGIVSLYVMLAIQATSYLRRWLSRRAWRVVHLLSYALVWGATIHAGMAGTDVTNRLYQGMAFVLSFGAITASLVRILTPRRRPVPA